MDLQKMKDDPTMGQLDADPQSLSRPHKPKRTQPLRPMDGVIAEFSDGEYEKLLDMYDQSLRTLAEGEVVRGRILRISGGDVIVDVGYKSEGIIDLDEFIGPDGKPHVTVGDEIDVLLEKTENKDGYVVLSKEKAEKMKIWEEIEHAYTDGRPVTGIVKERIKGGLAVDIGVRAFLPGSLVDIRPVRNLDAMKGKELQMRVIKVNRKRGNIVLSRKAVLEEENAHKKRRTLDGLNEGKVIRGTVKNITEYGAFIDLGGIDGLLHKTDMSWGRVNHPSELFVVGDEVEVVVLKFDPDKERVSLGYKQRSSDPWENVEDKYARESRVRGKVVSLTDYGAFIELEPGVEGLIHVSEMSWTKRVKHPSKVLNVGDTVEAVVLDVDKAARRLSLGLRQTEPNPWHMIGEKYHEGDRITGKVRNLTDFGAFIEVEEGIDGLVHISDMSWTKRLKHPSEMLKKGDDVEAVILKIDSENQRLSLGIKQLQPNVWEEFFKNHVIGDLITGRIVRLTDFGAFVEIVEGIEGLVHVSEIAEERVEKPSDRLSLDQAVTAKVIKIDIAEQKIGLSIKGALQDQGREDVRAYMRTQGSGAINLGEVAGHAGGRRREEKRRRGGRDSFEEGEDE
ncbi:MAG TPA: 30S ribosomal protein S1 [Candidatus Polarisedimenticolia bacterium]|nr:30S ribosomal protein S1 [Candidatus Polarisedimenticolia bacterium]